MNWRWLLDTWLYDLRLKRYDRDKFFRVLDELPGLLPVQILKGTYTGTIFSITDIKVIDDSGKTKFDFDVINRVPGKNYDDTKFAKLVGEILLICIGEAQNNFASVRQEVLSDGTEPDIVEEPTPTRTIPAEGTPLPTSRILRRKS